MRTTARGSIWRKWDLHVHTPYTKMNNGYGDNNPWDKFITTLENSDVRAFGITDYNSADNFFEFKRQYELAYPETTKTFFFNLELRLEVSVNRKAEEVNAHIIFDNDIPDFHSRITTFLTRLDTTIKRNGASVPYSNLRDSDHDAACIGDYQALPRLLREVFGNDKPYIIIAASNNQGLRPDTTSPRKLNTTDEIDKICDGFFGNAGSKNYFLDTNRYESDEKAEPKPVFAGCDSHSFEDLEVALGKQVLSHDTKGNELIEKEITWIRADTTFAGLKQAFIEPNDRVYLGAMPPKMQAIQDSRTHYIDYVRIFDKTGANKSWFNSKIPLNPGLVAIIGRKGSGKSALTDIIALAGRSHADSATFSFLTRDKFLRQPSAGNYAIELSWLNGEQKSYDLNSSINSASEIERVRYLPQKFVEGICNEFGVRHSFQDEIDRVIFSYVKPENRLGAATLSELIGLKSASIDGEIADLTSRLHSLNAHIDSLENKSVSEYLIQLEDKIKKKKEEIQSLPKPTEVPKPAPVKPEDTIEIERLTGRITDLTNQRDVTVEKIRLINIQNQKATNALSKLDTYKDQLDRLIDDLRNDMSSIGIDAEQLLTLKVNRQILTNKIQSLGSEKETHQANIGEGAPFEEAKKASQKFKSYPEQIKELEDKRKLLQAKLSAPEQEYQRYLTALRRYDDQVKQLMGDETNPNAGTLNSLLHEQTYVKDTLKTDLQSQYEARNDLAGQVYKRKVSKTGFFEEIYQPVVDLLDKEKASQQEADSVLTFTVEPVFNTEQFVSEFTRTIHFNRKGYFMGKEEGVEALQSLILRHDTKTLAGMLELVSEIINKLQFADDGSPQKVPSQLLNSVTATELYDYLYGMSYLDVRYNLQFNGKDLSENQFSPGEKGALLLIFYLLIEQSNDPLLIDQPEENLDNESVYQLLVPYIKKVRSRRQVIIVTHNPNLAVVCDADQIIHSTMDKKTNNIKYVYGSLEAADMNKRVSDVLEGTLPAFDIRNKKYDRR